MATATPDVYASNTALYQDPGLAEGVDDERRYRDDGVARSLCGGVLNVLSLHGFDASLADLPDDAQAVLVGGRNDTLKQHLLRELDAVDVDAIDAAGHERLNGNEATNIANRTLLGVFWAFVAACRNALARLEASQEIL
jgi:phage replication-related protein YjqB (UPF0714/DUF867 family)